MQAQPLPEDTIPVAIIGAGPGGICVGAQLGKVGIPYVVLEKADRLGGTWRENIYPGSASDNPSHQYSYSFELNPDWTRTFALQPELLAYFEHCAVKYGVADKVRCNVEVTEASFDEPAGVWHIETTKGPVNARCLVSAVGQLNRPTMPDIEGLEEFPGKMFHSAGWDAEHDLTGRKVAVIGNGASAIQIIPEIYPTAESVTIFQRTPNWVQPRGDRFYGDTERWLFKHVPLLARLYRYAVYWKLERQFPAFIRDSVAAAKREVELASDIDAYSRQETVPALTPDYPVGCKRVLVADDYYQTLQQPNVELITTPIDRFDQRSILTTDGTHHPVDTCILATGFKATEFLMPMQLKGMDGRDLQASWQDGAEAYLGITVSGFPNFFMLYGPNTNLGHNSIIFMIECQTRYILQCLKHIFERDLLSLDVTPQAMAQYNRVTQSKLEKTAWTGGCGSWYKNAGGRVTNNWPETTPAYFWRTLKPELQDYQMRLRDGSSLSPPFNEYAWSTCA